MIKPLPLDEDTVALYRFDEGHGNEARSACGDPSLTLRAAAAQWGERPGGGAVARFERRDDDATVFAGPVNHDKLHFRTCPEAWTVEAWVRYTGDGGRENGHTYVQLCGTDDEGFGLNGVRGGWIFSLANMDKIVNRDRSADLKAGIAPAARFMGSLRGRDPNHDTAGIMYPRGNQSGTAYVGADRGLFIHDHDWHHVAWQFRYIDQTHWFYIDGRLITHLQLPTETQPFREIINDAVCGVLFTVGGFHHSQNPPYHLGHGNLEGEIADLRISRVLRYPVAERLSIVKCRGPVAEDLNLVVGGGLEYRLSFSADEARGRVHWRVVEGALPEGLSLDETTGEVSGRPGPVVEPRPVTIEARDEAGETDRHTVCFEVRPGAITTESLPPAFVGSHYETALASEHLAGPLHWEIATGALPAGLSLSAEGSISGTPAESTTATRSPLRVQVTDARGVRVERDLMLNILPPGLAPLKTDADTVFLYDWQGEKARLIYDVMGDEDMALDWTNMGGDRRVHRPGRSPRFPQETGHGEHGFVSLAINHDKHNLRTCRDAWTVEAWVRRGGDFLAFGRWETERTPRFEFGHICGTYDHTQRGVWELYLSALDSPDAGMTPGVHFFGAEPEQALPDLDSWKRPEGLMCDPADAGIRDTEWHHVAWQYHHATDRHELLLDGRLIWRMTSPDKRRLVNNRQHEAQFSVFSRLDGPYIVRGQNEHGKKVRGFNWDGWGNFFGQIGEIRVSNVTRYHTP